MATFKYVAYDANGKKVESTVEADNQGIAQQILVQERKLMVSAINEVKAGGGGISLFSRRKAGGRDLEFLTSELSLLLESGVKFDKAVDLLAKAKRSTPIGEVLGQISGKLKSGSTIADAFGHFGKLFNNLYVNLLKIGEESGALAPVFQGLTRDLRYRNDLRQTIIQATTYPLIILAVCVLSVVLIFNYIVPNMASLFDGVEDLPIQTRAILAMSDWMIAYQFYVLAIFVAITAAIIHNRNNPKMQQWFHQRSRLVPGVRHVVDMSERIRFCSSMSLLLNAGIAMDQAVRLSAGNSANSEIRRELEGVGDQIRKGTHLSKALSDTTLFPELFVSLIEIGEESGEVTRIFTDLSERSRNEFTNWVNRVTSLLEPLLIITMGLFVGGIVVTMMLSVMSINQSVM